MSNIYTSVDQMIGRTPLMELTRIEKAYGLKARVLAKLEYLNPAGSVKDRVAKEMIDEAERTGKLGPGSVIIEPTSGNTGIGLAAVAAARGYRIIIVMPETMSMERRQLMKAYGAELVLTKGVEGMKGAIAKAEELADEIPGSFIPGQFVNPSNPKAHRESTGPEIYEDTDGKVDVFVAGVGTGGTITGVGEYLKSKNPAVRIVAVEPASSAVLSSGEAGAHKIQGIGAGFIPEVLNTSIYDEIIPVSDEDAFAAGKSIGRKEGILVGISSGAAAFAAIELAKRSENEGKTIVVLLPDTRDRYLSTPLFAEEEVIFMMISTEGRHALRVKISLAENYGKGYIPMKEVAQRQNISLKYLERILPVLTKNKMIEGLQGKKGGYRLAAEPEGYRVGDILRLTEGNLAPVACLSCETNTCERVKSCRTLPMWTEFYRLTNSYFDGITLADLMNSYSSDC